ncbi:phosphopantetheine-binding protein [Patulibacter sp. NPDC049589]|uniref:phosphopantetheine-binding protein n=1 Tax=Patulibacter sp. NPDC049589 TaxID=3154731 RepID=UPI003431A53A
MSRLHDIKTVIVENFAPDVAPDDLPDDYELIENGVLTSLSLVRLITALGERFGIDLDIADLSPQAFRTARTIDDFLATAAPDPVS